MGLGEAPCPRRRLLDAAIGGSDEVAVVANLVLTVQYCGYIA